MKSPAIYIITNRKNGVLYTGVTSNLVQRISEHKNSKIKGFAHRYNCHILIYYERHSTMESAILREKQIKAGSRKSKILLIESFNKEWHDLYDSLF